MREQTADSNNTAISDFMLTSFFRMLSSRRFLAISFHLNKIDKDVNRSVKKLTYAKPVTSTSGYRRVRTKSGLKVVQKKLENYHGYEHDWKDKRKYKNLDDFQKKTHFKLKGLPENHGGTISGKFNQGIFQRNQSLLFNKGDTTETTTLEEDEKVKQVEIRKKVI